MMAHGLLWPRPSQFYTVAQANADRTRKSAPGAAKTIELYHLVSNLAEAVERDVQLLQILARAALPKSTDLGRAIPRFSHGPKDLRSARRESIFRSITR